MDWNTIMHTALLGTDKGSLPQEGSGDLEEVFKLVREQETDKEDQFLQIASIAMNWRKCGLLAVHEPIQFPAAAPEEQPYCSEAARRVLDDILSAGNMPLLQLWLHLCATNNQLLPPEQIPVLFDLWQGSKSRSVLHESPLYSSTHQLLLTCAGRRGEWLLKWNDGWKLEEVQIDENTWHTGTLQQRVLYLQQLRKTEPAGARELLQQAWPQENANTRAEFLKHLHGTTSNDDLPWLQSLLTEKSQKVKDETLSLLKKITSSSVVQQYQQILKESVVIKKTKGLWGIGSKTEMDIQLTAAMDEAVFKTGIEKMSSQKGVADADHILYQLISAVPPAFFEEQSGLPREEIILLFKKTKQPDRYIAALRNGAIAFGDTAWLKSLASVYDHEFYPEVLGMYDKEEAEKYALAFLNKSSQADHVVNSAVYYLQTEWSRELTLQVFKYTATHYYQYNRSFYSNHVLLFPADILPGLPGCTPAEQYAREAWIKTSEWITQLINLKVQTYTAFKQ